MTAPRDPHGGLSPEQRKRQLRAEGAVHRASLVASLQEAKSSLQAEEIARDAGAMLASSLLGMVRAKSAASGGWQALLPLAVNAASLVSGKPFLRKLLRMAAVAASAAGIAGMFLRKKTSGAAPAPRHATEERDDSGRQ